MSQPDPRYDVDGNEVDVTTEMCVRALQDRTDSKRVVCNWHVNGMIQYYGKRSYVEGRVFQIARDHGYRVRLAGYDQLLDGEERGYVELERVPEEGGPL